jgi:hypothetical protein
MKWFEHCLLCSLLCQDQPFLVSTRLTAALFKSWRFIELGNSSKVKSRNLVIDLGIEGSTKFYRNIKKVSTLLIHSYRSQYKTSPVHGQYGGYPVFSIFELPARNTAKPL